MAEEQKVDGQSAEENSTQASNASDQAQDTAQGNDNGSEVSDELAALEAEELIAHIKKVQAKADENWDIALRTKAEMENVRRRTEKEISNARKFGVEKLVNEIIPVKDSMEMGLKAAIELDTDDKAVHKIREGMELTLKMMNDAMAKIGVKEVAPQEGEPFNADFHQAMSMQEVPGRDPNTIVAVVQKGYTLNDRLIRPAMIMVAK